MILSRSIQRAKRHIPYVSILLLCSCLVTTLPQFFLSETYSEITGSPLRYNMPWAISVTAFSHSPSILYQHVIGNILVLLSMGMLIEIALGSNIFAIVSVTTFVSTSLLGLLRGLDSSHGASGIFWGYHTVVFMILVAYKEKYGWRGLVREPYLYLFGIVTVFDIIGINCIEAFVLKKRFFDNFGQTIHLLSLLCVVPFILIFHDEIKKRIMDFLDGESADPGKEDKFCIAFLAAVCAVNLIATLVIMDQTVKVAGISYVVMPTKDLASNRVANVVVCFSEDVKIHSEDLVDYSVTSNDEKIEWDSKWIDERRMRVDFSKPVEDREKVFLKYVVKSKAYYPITVCIDNKDF